MLCGLELVYKMHAIDNGLSSQSVEVNLHKEVAGIVCEMPD